MKTALVCQLLKIDGFFHVKVLLKMSEDFVQRNQQDASVSQLKKLHYSIVTVQNLTNSTSIRLSQLCRIYAFIRNAAFGAWTFPEGAAIAHLLVASGLATREV
jgi:hypothetical protein